MIVSELVAGKGKTSSRVSRVTICMCLYVRIDRRLLWRGKRLREKDVRVKVLNNVYLAWYLL